MDVKSSVDESTNQELLRERLRLIGIETDQESKVESPVSSTKAQAGNRFSYTPVASAGGYSTGISYDCDYLELSKRIKRFVRSGSCFF